MLNKVRMLSLSLGMVQRADRGFTDRGPGFHFSRTKVWNLSTVSATCRVTRSVTVLPVLGFVLLWRRVVVDTGRGVLNDVMKYKPGWDAGPLQHLIHTVIQLRVAKCIS